MSILSLVKYNLKRLKGTKIIYFIFILEFIYLIIQVVFQILLQFGVEKYGINKNIIQFFPAFFIKDWTNKIIPIVMIFIVSTYFVSELETKRVALPILRTGSRAKVFFAQWLSLHILIILIMTFSLLTSLLAGMPLRYYYFKYFEMYHPIISAAPLNMEAITLSAGILFFQIIVLNCIIQVTILFGVIFKNRLKAGLAGIGFWITCIFFVYRFPKIEKYTYLYYTDNFISLQVSKKSGDIMWIQKITDFSDLLRGLLVCLLPGIILYIIISIIYVRADV